MEFAGWPNFSVEEAEIVKSVLLSNKVNYWTGQEGRCFETEFARYFGSKYAIAVANGTLAIDLALIALEIGQGDEVLVTSRTFIASVSAIINAGAVPVFVDVDEDSQNIDPHDLITKISLNTKAILCVHLAGWPCEMDKIMKISQDYNLKVIEDCAQAHGAKYKGKSVGTFGDVGCWSFCQDKIMTTGGEGGMVTTESEKLWRKMWSFKDHGKEWDKVYSEEHPPGFRWLHSTFGTNWRLTEMQSAIGRFQLKKLDEWNAKRKTNADMIFSAARKTKLFRVPDIPKYVEHAYYKAYFFVKGDVQQRDAIVKKINENNIPCFTGSCSEVYLEEAFEGTGLRPKERLKVARKLGESSIAFNCHPALTGNQMERICSVITEVGND